MTELDIQNLETKACEIVFSATDGKGYENQLTQQLIFLTLEKLILKAGIPNLEEKMFRLLKEVPISFQQTLEKPGIHRTFPLYRKLLNKKYFQGLKTSILIRNADDPTYLLSILAHEEDHGFNEGASVIDRKSNKVVYRTGLKIMKSNYESMTGTLVCIKTRNLALEELCTVKQSEKMRDLAIYLKTVNLKYLGKMIHQLQPQTWHLGYPTLRMVASPLFCYLEPMLEAARQSGNIDHIANIYNQVMERENAFETLNRRLDRLYESKISRRVSDFEAMQDLQTQVKQLETDRIYRDIQTFNKQYQAKGWANKKVNETGYENFQSRR